jgi:hypothetical protein
LSSQRPNVSSGCHNCQIALTSKSLESYSNLCQKSNFKQIKVKSKLPQPCKKSNCVLTKCLGTKAKSHQMTTESTRTARSGNFPVGLGLKRGDFLAQKGAPKIGQKVAPQSPKPNGKLLARTPSTDRFEVNLTPHKSVNMHPC